MEPKPISHYYKYVAPTSKTAPKHKAIRDAATEAALLPLTLDDGFAAHGDPSGLPALYAHISHKLCAFHEVIVENAPASADRSAAERCCRLARMLANEAVTAANVRHDLGEGRRLMSLANDQIMLARMQASVAVALLVGRD